MEYLLSVLQLPIRKDRRPFTSCTQKPQVTEPPGDPLIGCKPECLLNQDCPSDKTCINSKCLNPVQEHVESMLSVKCPTIITYTLVMRATLVTPLSSVPSRLVLSHPRTIRHLPAFTLWTQCRVFNSSIPPSVQMSAWLFWKTSFLQTRVRYQQ